MTSQDTEKVPVKEEKAEEPKEEPKVVEVVDDGVDYSDIEKRLLALKERGNSQFKRKAYKEAIKHFSEAIKLFEDTDRPVKYGQIKTLITQIFTNRSTSFHLLNQQNSAEIDATFVLDHLDTDNKKAMYRRAHAYRCQKKYEEACRDLSNLLKTHGQDKEIKKELDQCMAEMLKAKKQAEEEAKNRPKIQEVEEPKAKPGFKKVQIEEESSEDSDDEEARKKTTAKKATGKTTFDRETLVKA